MEKQPVSLYRHTIADICILVNPSTKEIIPQQSTQVLEYMQTNHAHDSIQSLINSKILVMVGGSSISTRASLVNPAEKKPMKDPKIENEPIGKSDLKKVYFKHVFFMVIMSDDMVNFNFVAHIYIVSSI